MVYGVPNRVIRITMYACMLYGHQFNIVLIMIYIKYDILNTVSINYDKFLVCKKKVNYAIKLC